VKLFCQLLSAADNLSKHSVAAVHPEQEATDHKYVRNDTSQAGCGSGQPGMVVGAHSRGVETR